MPRALFNSTSIADFFGCAPSKVIFSKLVMRSFYIVRTVLIK